MAKQIKEYTLGGVLIDVQYRKQPISACMSPSLSHSL